MEGKKLCKLFFLYFFWRMEATSDIGNKLFETMCKGSKNYPSKFCKFFRNISSATWCSIEKHDDLQFLSLPSF